MADQPAPRVLIDGVLYVPVSDAHPSVRAIEDAIVSQWAGDDWREEYPDSINYLRVVVDDFDVDEGQTVQEFVASILVAMSQNG